MADNNLDPEEIRRLNESVKELADNTTGLGTSFGSFGTTTTSTKNTVQKLNQELDKLLKRTAALNQTSTESNRSGAKASKGFATVSDSSKELGKNFKGLSKATESLITQFNELGKTLSKITKVKPTTAGPGFVGGGMPYPNMLPEYELRLKALGKKLDENGKIIDILTKEQKENLRTIQRENKQKEVEEKKEDLRIRTREEGGKVVKELTDRYKDSGAIFTDLNNKVFELTGKSKLLTASWVLLTSIGKGLVDATTVMTKEVYNGARGADVSAKALKAFTDELGSATTAIGVALMLIPGMGALRWVIRGLGAATVIAGQAIKKYGEYNELAAEQTKKLFGAFNSLSKSGVLLTGGIDDVFEQMQKMGMSVSQIDDFIKILGENSKTLKLFGSTTSEGARKFVEVAGELYSSRAGRELELLGVVADEQREHTLKYMAQQTKMGMMQFKTQAQLVKGTEEYIKELVILQELTGATRKEQEEAREAVLAIDELRAAQLLAQERGDDKEAARLQRFFEGATVLMQMGLAPLAKGFAQYGAGGPATPEAASVLQSLPRLIQNTERGVGIANSLKDLGKDLKDATVRLAPTVQYGGGEAVQGVLAGKFADIDTVRRLLEQGKSNEEVIAELNKAAKTGNQNTQNVVDAGRNLQSAGMLMDGVVKQFNGAATIHNEAAKTFNNAVEKFGKIVGVPKPANAPTVPTAPAGPVSQGPTEQRLAQLNLKDRQETTGGGAVSNELLNLAENIQQAIPGTRFTALNDKFHQAKLPNSKHTKGKALDFTTNPRPQNAEEAAGIKQQVYALGANKVLDEYFADRNANTKGGHFHAEVARYGGAFSGPTSGYPVWLHKNEVAFKTEAYQALLSDASNSLTNYRNDVSKQPISSITPLSSQPNAGKLLSELISMTDDNNRLILNELYRSRLIQEDMLNALRTT